MKVRSLLPIVVAALLPLTGCIFHRAPHAPLVSTAKLRTATKDELIAVINGEANRISTLNATVDIAANVGNTKNNKVTDYPDIKGYLLVQKPAMLRMIGLLPLVRTTAFDMVSDGSRFKLSIPPKGKFIVGSNEVVRPSANALENLRPQVIMDSLLLRQIDLNNEVAVLESGTETVVDAKTKKPVIQPNYVLDVIDKDGHDWYLARKIYFSRIDLMPYQQVTYERMGNVATDTHYYKFQDFSGVMFPSIIDIYRPQERYTVELTIENMKINTPLRSDQFALSQPPGSQLVDVDRTPAAALRAQDGNAANLGKPSKTEHP
jgi:outer membrane lipoprotein-sorting protein